MSVLPTAATIPDTVVFDITPASGGAPWRIFLYQPPGEAPEEGWPVLYYTDANAVAGTAADIVRVQAAWPLGTGIGFGVMVGIGYPVEGAYDPLRRSWDLGPPPGKSYPPFTPDGPEARTGGADEFLAFIEDELKPEIARRARINPARQALLGHSFGGLFVLHTMFRKPDAFTDWISASPAIYWEGAGIVDAAEAFIASGASCAGRVLTIAGEFEQKLAPFQMGATDEQKRLANFDESRIVDNARIMAERLTRIPGLKSEYAFVPGETHMSIMPAVMNLAIRFAFSLER